MDETECANHACKAYRNRIKALAWNVLRERRADEENFTTSHHLCNIEWPSKCTVQRRTSINCGMISTMNLRMCLEITVTALPSSVLTAPQLYEPCKKTPMIQ